MQFYPKVTSRPWQYLLGAKSKTKNFGLFALYPCHFFYLLLVDHGCPMVSLNQVECSVGFEPGALQFDRSLLNHLATGPKLQETLYPDLHLVLPKCGNVPNTQIRNSSTLRYLQVCVIPHLMQNLIFKSLVLLINHISQLRYLVGQFS